MNVLGSVVIGLNSGFLSMFLSILCPEVILFSSVFCIIVFINFNVTFSFARSVLFVMLVRRFSAVRSLLNI